MRRLEAALLVLTGCSGGADLVVSEQQCLGYQDAVSTRSVTLRIENARATSVYLEKTCSVPYDVVVDGVTRFAALGPLHASCERAQAGEVPCCDCLPEPSEIAPGTSLELTWEGLFYEPRNMSEECVPEGPYSYTGCAQARHAADGPMTAVVHLHGAADCAIDCSFSDPFDVTQDFVLGSDAVVMLIVE
jgi:hypothetical protein